MRQICFILMMTSAAAGMAAGLQQLVNGITPKPVVPQPAPQPPQPQQPAPQPPKPPVKK